MYWAFSLTPASFKLAGSELKARFAAAYNYRKLEGYATGN